MSNILKIIGIAGTNGSGKDTVGHTLAERHNYLFVSVTELLREELKRRGVAINRESLRNLSADWRRQYGYGVLVDRAVERYKQVEGQYAGLAVASLRNPFEADRIHDLGGLVVWIDASPTMRYERIQANLGLRGRGGEDDKTYEEFLAEEVAEMHQSGDAATLDMSAVKVRSDLFLVNDGTNLHDFQNFITEQLFGVHDAPESTPATTPEQ